MKLCHLKLGGPVIMPHRVEWCGNRTLKIFLKICLFVSTAYTNMQADGHTPHNGIGRAYVCIALQKSQLHLVFHHELC